ncbi:MAG: SEC-C metal-binding domain-containing protein [Marinifilaceae bacterium]
MKKALDIFLSLFKSDREEEFYYVKIERNEKCYCNSGKKYKNCHLPDHEKRSKLAVRKIYEQSGEVDIKIISVKRLRKEFYRVRTNQGESV